MSGTASNVLQGKPLATGGVLVDPTTLPTTATAAVTGASSLGYVSEDGLTEGGERSTEKIKAWGGDTVKVVQTDHSVTYAFTCIESGNAEVLKTMYGADNVTVAGDTIAVVVTGEELPRRSYVFDMRDGDARIRIVVPDGQVASTGEITYTDGGVISYPVTIEALPDTQGRKVFKYIDRGTVV